MIRETGSQRVGSWSWARGISLVSCLRSVMAAQGGTAVEGAVSRLGVAEGRLAFSEPALPPGLVIIMIH